MFFKFLTITFFGLFLCGQAVSSEEIRRLHIDTGEEAISSGKVIPININNRNMKGVPSSCLAFSVVHKEEVKTLTAAHCVKDTSIVVDHNGLEYQVLKRDELSDVALLKALKSSFKTAYQWKVGKPEIGSPVVTYSYQSTFLNKNEEGQILIAEEVEYSIANVIGFAKLGIQSVESTNKEVRIKVDKTNIRLLRLYQDYQPNMIRKGYSGGPMIDLKTGTVIGITSYVGSEDTKAKSGNIYGAQLSSEFLDSFLE